jgi:hypothetical protein
MDSDSLKEGNMTYIFYVIFYIVGYHTYDKLRSLHLGWLLLHKFRSGVKDFIFIKLKLRKLLPYWAYRFGGGVVPTWTWRVILTSILLSPFLLLSWLGLPLNLDYVYFFVGGFVIAEIIRDRLAYLEARKLIHRMVEENDAVRNFVMGNTKKNEE